MINSENINCNNNIYKYQIYIFLDSNNSHLIINIVNDQWIARLTINIIIFKVILHLHDSQN